MNFKVHNRNKKKTAERKKKKYQQRNVEDPSFYQKRSWKKQSILLKH